MSISYDELGWAGELRLDPSLTQVQWGICDDYVLRDPDNLPNGEHDRAGQYIEPKYPITLRDRWRSIRPLEEPNLVFDFARTYEQVQMQQNTDKPNVTGPVLEWCRKYGLVGTGGYGWSAGSEEETVQGYIREMQRIWRMLRLYSAVLDKDEDAAKELLLGRRKHGGPRRVGEDHGWYRMDLIEHALFDFGQTVAQNVHKYCRPTVVLPPRSRDLSKVCTAWDFDNLLGPMYLQLYWFLGAQGQAKRCKMCGYPMFKARKDKKFCSEPCRRNWNYHYGEGKSSKEARRRVRSEGQHRTE